MKTTRKNTLVTLLLLLCLSVAGQQSTVAVLNIDVNGIEMDAVSMGNLVRLEVEKTQKYKVLDKYDLAYLIKNQDIDISNCYGRICMVEAGKILEADKMLTGRVEKFDDKIIVILRLIDVNSGTIEKSNIMEYIDLPELQQMIHISVNNIVGIENDPNIVNMLSSYEDPINTPKTKLKLNGPRMGVSYMGGNNGQIIQRPKDQGGYDAFPLSAIIGYQFEKSYLSAGDFQALFEFLPMVAGLDQNRFVPSFTVMNGIRSNNTGLEIAFGPIFEITRMANVFQYEGTWYLQDDYPSGITPDNISERLDSRGNIKLTTSWVWAVGKTFRSGYLNIPVNAYFSAKKNGWVTGLSFGFNISKK